MWNVIKEIEIPLAERQWKASDFVRAARKMGYPITDTLVSEWRSNKRHPNANSIYRIRAVFAAHPPQQ